MFWQIISGIAAAAGSPGRYRITRSRFRFLGLLIAAIWVLFGIWVWKRPDIRGGNGNILIRGRSSSPGTLHTGTRHSQRQPVRERGAG
ncbi:MAG: hypothetical protein GKC07_08690 [Methanomicrobiales archaeon]|nr:hypothetical protein [Methanomicrobiales archaeon]